MEEECEDVMSGRRMRLCAACVRPSQLLLSLVLLLRPSHFDGFLLCIEDGYLEAPRSFVVLEAVEILLKSCFGGQSSAHPSELERSVNLELSGFPYDLL